MLLIPGENGAVFKQSGSSTSSQGEAFKPQWPKTEPQEQSLLKTTTKSPDFSNSDDHLFRMTKMQLQCDYDERDKSIKSYVVLKMEKGSYKNWSKLESNSGFTSKSYLTSQNLTNYLVHKWGQYQANLICFALSSNQPNFYAKTRVHSK